MPHVLIAGGGAPTRHQLSSVLRYKGWFVRATADTTGLIHRLGARGASPVDLVLIVAAGTDDPLTSVAQTRRMDASLPVAVVAPNADAALCLRAFVEGAHDVIGLPVDPHGLHVRLSVLLRLARQDTPVSPALAASPLLEGGRLSVGA